MGYRIPNFEEVTEHAGELVSTLQVRRFIERYSWGAKNVEGKSVIEIGCGTGPGLRLLNAHARHIVATDISEILLKKAKSQYAAGVDFVVCDAQHLPFAPDTFDAVFICEAIYYLPDFEAALSEFRRILKPDGIVLIVTVNKDIPGFVPSAYSTTYLGVPELSTILSRNGFRSVIYGSDSIIADSAIGRFIGALKGIAARLGVLPKTMQGKKWLRRLFYGRLVPMPVELDETLIEPSNLSLLDCEMVDRVHRILYCRAERSVP